MRAIIFLVLLGCLGILFVQNLQPVSLVFFGFYKTTPLPLSVWLISFLGAGLLSSAASQILSNLVSQKSPKIAAKVEKPPKTSKNKETNPKSEVKNSRFEADWNAQNKGDDDEWDIEQPPKKTSQINDDQPSPQETSPPPQTGERPSSVYSYSYRDKENRTQGATDQIYDANYRVIKPPVTENNQPREDQEDEDWI